MNVVHCYAYLNIPGGYSAIGSEGDLIDKTILNELQRATTDVMNKRNLQTTAVDLGALGALYITASFSDDRADETGRTGIITAAAILFETTKAFEPIKDLSELFNRITELRDALIEHHVPSEYSRLAIKGALAAFVPTTIGFQPRGGRGASVSQQEIAESVRNGRSWLNLSRLIQVATMICSVCTLIVLLLLSWYLQMNIIARTTHEQRTMDSRPPTVLDPESSSTDRTPQYEYVPNSK